MLEIGCGALTVQVEGADSELIERLRQLFFLTVAPASSGHASWRIRIERTLGPPALDGDQLIEAEFAEMAKLRVGPPRVVSMLTTGGSLQIDQIRRELVIRNPSLRDITIDLYRSIRQIIIASALDQGFTCLHAGSIAKQGHCVILLGDKGAGKTTTTGHLARDGGFEVLSNDKLLLDPEGRAVHLIESPAVMIGTLRSLPELEARWHDMTRGTLRAADCFNEHPPLPDVTTLPSRDPVEKLFFSECEWAALLRSSGVTSASVAGIVELSRSRSEVPQVTRIPTIDLAGHRDALVPFRDWTGLRRGRAWPVVQAPSVPCYRVVPSPNIDATRASLRALCLDLVASAR